MNSPVCPRYQDGADEENVATLGLRISDSPTSDNLTPQETTSDVSHDMGPDGARLSCPGRNVVAENGEDNSELNPRI